jgi:hypothetical protein
MKVADRLHNRYEEVVFKELSSIAAENALRIFSMIRVSDVLLKADTWLSGASRAEWRGEVRKAAISFRTSGRWISASTFAE